MLITQAEYARRRGVSKPAVRHAVQAGRITLIDGKVDPEQADQQWDRNSNRRQQRERKPRALGRDIPEKLDNPLLLNETGRPRKPQLSTPNDLETLMGLGTERNEGDFLEAQRQHEWEKVRKERDARRVREGKLVEAEAVRRIWERHIDAVKGRLLLLESKVPPECRAMVSKEIRSALRELSEYQDAA